MKKMLSLLPIAALIFLYSSNSIADRDGWRGEGYEHHGHYRERYYPQPSMGYYPPPPPRYRGGSPQGLAGGIVGSVLGYEMGNGDPVATGLGAAAGSYIGNGMVR
jgi:hypothetical protein